MSKVTRKELARVIGEKTMHIKDKQALVASVAAYVATERSSIDLNSLVRDIMQYRLEHGIVEAVAVSAHELDGRVMRDIEEMLQEHFPAAKHIVIDTRIDQDVVGGVRIELPQENLDLSVRNKLNLLKRLTTQEGIR